MKRESTYWILLVLLVICGCQKEKEQVDTIYINGDILTMNGESPEYVEALVESEGVIVFAGGKKEALEKYSGTEKDLEGRTLIPGFIDPHSHILLQSAKFSCVNLDPYPIGDVKNIADIQRKLGERIQERKPEAGAVIIGWGYDDTGLEEMRHPNRDDLDEVSTEQAIVLMHISSHLMACNSKALELAGITADTPDPEGGVIQRRAGSREPLGVMEENAMFTLFGILPTPTPEESAELLIKGLEKYAAEGITTCQEGATLPSAIKLLEELKSTGKLPIDIVSYPLYKGVNDSLLDVIAENFGNTSAVRTPGIKLVTDGSIQGYTAYLSQPYHKLPNNHSAIDGDQCENELGEQIVTGDTAYNPHGEESEPELTSYRGYPSMTQEYLEEWIRKADERGIQMLIHCNGDAAVDNVIAALEQVRGDKPRPDLRTTIIHAQTIRDEQIDYAAENGLILSFFPIHVNFWGDRHEQLFLGPERAARINPANSALKKGATITLHHDAPIAHWGMLPVVSAAVNRITTGGKLLGAGERISPYEALCAVTRDAAFQSFEENRKGTLTAGKLADLVILDKNPLKIDPLEIGDIQVIETIKAGKTVYIR